MSGDRSEGDAAAADLLFLLLGLRVDRDEQLGVALVLWTGEGRLQRCEGVLSFAHGEERAGPQ